MVKLPVFRVNFFARYSVVSLRLPTWIAGTKSKESRALGFCTKGRIVSRNIHKVNSVFPNNESLY